MPEWWIQASGFFFIVGAIAMLMLIFLVMVLLWTTLDLAKQVKGLMLKVDGLTTKADAIANQVQAITTEVGTRATGISSVVDQHAKTAFVIIEKLAPVLLGIGVVMRLSSLVKKSPRRRSKKQTA